jgi:hypothetical protein
MVMPRSFRANSSCDSPPILEVALIGMEACGREFSGPDPGWALARSYTLDSVSPSILSPSPRAPARVSRLGSGRCLAKIGSIIPNRRLVVLSMCCTTSAVTTLRVAISNHRLVSFEDGQVTFRWRDSAHNHEQS